MHPVLEIPLNAKVEKTFHRLIAVIGEPWKTLKRGRPPERQPFDYALALFAKAFYNWSYHTAEAILEIPKSCLQWAFTKLSNAWVQALVKIHG